MADTYQEIAYDEAVRSIEAQQHTLETLRGRASGLLAGAALVTSFLGGQALTRSQGVPRIDVAGWFAVGAFVTIAVLAVVILWPYKWRFAMGANKILAGSKMVSSPTELHEGLARFHHRNLGKNAVKLEWLFWAFRVQCLALLVETVMWLIALRT